MSAQDLAGSQTEAVLISGVECSMWNRSRQVQRAIAAPARLRPGAIAENPQSPFAIRAVEPASWLATMAIGAFCMAALLPQINAVVRHGGRRSAFLRWSCQTSHQTNRPHNRGFAVKPRPVAFHLNFDRFAVSCAPLKLRHKLRFLVLETG